VLFQKPLTKHNGACRLARQKDMQTNSYWNMSVQGCVLEVVNTPADSCISVFVLIAVALVR
jgi:hypothetical protein